MSGFEILLVICLILSLVSTWAQESVKKDLREEAVKRGYATWFVYDDRSGSVEFRWLDKPVTLPAEQSNKY